MEFWGYWLAVIGYLGASLAARTLPSRWRWPSVAGIAVIGVLALLPVTCRSLIMPVCEPGDPRSCDASADSCSTLVGIGVPFADAAGSAGSRFIAAGLILAGVAIVLIGRTRAVRD